MENAVTSVATGASGVSSPVPKKRYGTPSTTIIPLIGFFSPCQNDTSHAAGSSPASQNEKNGSFTNNGYAGNRLSLSSIIINP